MIKSHTAWEKKLLCSPVAPQRIFLYQVNRLLGHLPAHCHTNITDAQWMGVLFLFVCFQLGYFPLLLCINWTWQTFMRDLHSVTQTDSLGCVLWGGTVSRPDQTSASLCVLCGDTLGLGGLISRLLGIQRVFREQDTDGRDSPLHGYTWGSLLGTLPDLIHRLVVELWHLVEFSHFSFQNLHTSDGLGDSSSWASEDHLSQRCPIAVFPFPFPFPFHASCCKPQ